MNYSKIRSVKSPTRGTAESAGIDFFVPQIWDEEKEEFIDEFEPSMVTRLLELNPTISLNNLEIFLHPGDRVMIPSGIKVNLNSVMPRGYISFTYENGSKVHMGVMLTAHNKSGVGTKKGLDRLAEVVDSDYQGEVHISVVNTSNTHQIIKPGDKLIQFILEPVFLPMPNEVPIEDLFTETSERGEGGFGSTGEK